MDFGKCMNAALLPTVAAVVLGIIGTVIGNIPVVNFLICCLGIPMMIVNALLLVWAGFNAGKGGQEIVGGAVTGVIAGGASSLIVGIVGAILGAVLNVLLVALGGDIVGAVISSLVGGIVSIILGFGFWVVIGAVCGAIGAFAATQMK